MGMPPLTDLLRNDRESTFSVEGVTFTNNPAARLWDVMVRFKNGLPPMKTKIKASTREQARAFTLARYPYADPDKIEVAAEGELAIKPLPERKAAAVPRIAPAPRPSAVKQREIARQVEVLTAPKPAPRLEPLQSKPAPAAPCVPMKGYHRSDDELEHRFIVAMWRQDGGKITSQNLMGQLGADDVSFTKVRTALAAAGRIVVQRGAGAYITLPTVAEAIKAAATSLAEPAVEEEVPEPVSPADELPPLAPPPAKPAAPVQLTPGTPFPSGGVLISDENARLAAEKHHRGEARWVDIAAEIGCNPDYLRKRAKPFTPPGPRTGAIKRRRPVSPSKGHPGQQGALKTVLIEDVMWIHGVQPMLLFHPIKGWSSLWTGAFSEGSWLLGCGFTHALRLSDLPRPVE